jgi:hypothetical protein
VSSESVLVPRDADWLPGIVLWEFMETGRSRALVRYELPGGLVIRRAYWRDELRSGRAPRNRGDRGRRPPWVLRHCGEYKGIQHDQDGEVVDDGSSEGG